MLLALPAQQIPRTLQPGQCDWSEPISVVSPGEVIGIVKTELKQVGAQQLVQPLEKQSGTCTWYSGLPVSSATT